MAVENLDGEIWRYVMSEEIGFYPYMVSNKGRVKSLNFNGTGKEKLLKQRDNGNSYLRFYLCRKGEKPRKFFTHRLVAHIFLKNPDPDNFHFINHRDENPSNNCVENLEWCDSFYNNRYGSKAERFKKTIETSETWKEGRKKWKKALDESDAWKEYVKKQSKPVHQYTKNGLELVRIYDSTMQVERETKYSSKNISACCRGERKSAYGYIWRYEPIEPSTETEKN